MIKVHHLNCGSMCPFGGALIDGHSHGFRSHLVSHCLALETNAGIVLVDTGIGSLDIISPELRVSKTLKKVLNIQLKLEETAIAQIQKIGFQSEDVTHIILTHLDFDHAGGISDFPNARVHVLRSEVEAAMEPISWAAKHRYKSAQWNNQTNWETYERGGENWNDFKCVRNLVGLPPEILIVPLVGHTLGHSGVAIDTGDGWLLHAGDAYFNHSEIETEKYHCPIGLRLYQRLMEADRDLRIMNQARLRNLKKNCEGRIEIFSSHDELEFEHLRKAKAMEHQQINYGRSIDFHQEHIH